MKGLEGRMIMKNKGYLIVTLLNLILAPMSTLAAPSDQDDDVVAFSAMTPSSFCDFYIDRLAKITYPNSYGSQSVRFYMKAPILKQGEVLVRVGALARHKDGLNSQWEFFDARPARAEIDSDADFVLNLATLSVNHHGNKFRYSWELVFLLETTRERYWIHPQSGGNFRIDNNFVNYVSTSLVDFVASGNTVKASQIPQTSQGRGSAVYINPDRCK